MKSFIRFIMIVAQPTIIWLGIYSGIYGFRNIAYVLIAFLGIIAPLVMFSALLEPNKKRVPKLVVFTANSADGVSCALLIWNGWLWCAAIMILQWICAVAYYYDANNPVKTTEK